MRSGRRPSGNDRERIVGKRIHYRLSQHAPYPAPMHDSAGAVQFPRSKAREWNLDAEAHPRALWPQRWRRCNRLGSPFRPVMLKFTAVRRATIAWMTVTLFNRMSLSCRQAGAPEVTMIGARAWAHHGSAVPLAGPPRSERFSGVRCRVIRWKRTHPRMSLLL